MLNSAKLLLIALMVLQIHLFAKIIKKYWKIYQINSIKFFIMLAVIVLRTSV